MQIKENFIYFNFSVFLFFIDYTKFQEVHRGTIALMGAWKSSCLF